MSRTGKRFLLVMLAAAAAGAAGCGLPPSRVQFIETLAKDNRKIAHSTRAFHNAIQPLLKGEGPPNAGTVRQAYEDMAKTVKEVRAEADGQLLPPASTSAKDFLDAYKDYLAGQQDILDNSLLPIVQKIEQPAGADGRPTLDEKRDFCTGLLGKIAAKENETWYPLKQAQTAYASEHNYMVFDVAGYLANQKAGK